MTRCKLCGVFTSTKTCSPCKFRTLKKDKMCDWCWINHSTRPVVLGNSRTGEIVDVIMCERAIGEIRSFRDSDELVRIGLADGRTFEFNMWEA